MGNHGKFQGTTNAGAKYVGKNHGTAGLKANASQKGSPNMGTGKTSGVKK